MASVSKFTVLLTTALYLAVSSAKLRDNLFEMYLLYNLAKHSVRVNDETKVLEIEKSKKPMAYPEAAELATQNAKSDSEGFLRRLPFLRRGTEIGDPTNENNKKTVP